jgi:hypothetical protein
MGDFECQYALSVASSKPDTIVREALFILGDLIISMVVV